MALVFDKDFYEFLVENQKLISSRDETVLLHVIDKSLELCVVVEIDEKEQGDRALLNFGHTFGHALESYFDYSEKLLHGEAVSLGMMLAACFSNKEGFLSK